MRRDCSLDNVLIEAANSLGHSKVGNGYLQPLLIFTMEPSDLSLSWVPCNNDASLRPSNPSLSLQSFKFRRRDESKPLAHCTPKRSKSPVPVLPVPVMAVPVPKSPVVQEAAREEGREDLVQTVETIVKSLDTFQQEMKALLRIDVKTPREEDLEKLILRNNSSEEVLNRLFDSVRLAEERAAAERKSLLETEQEDSQLLQEASAAMEASISELNRELRGLQGISSMYERVSGIKLESQGNFKVRGNSLTPSRPFTFELDLSPEDTRYRNLTKSAEHLDAFLQHEISSLRNSELPMLFRRMLRALHPLNN